MSNHFTLLRFLNTQDGNEPLFKLLDQPSYGSHAPQTSSLTTTGWIWLLLPVYFIGWKQLRWTLLEWLVFTATWGSSSAALFPVLIRHHLHLAHLALIMYALFHLFSVGFALIAYMERREGKPLQMDRVWRSTQIYLFFGFLTVLIHTAAWVIR